MIGSVNKNIVRKVKKTSFKFTNREINDIIDLEPLTYTHFHDIEPNMSAHEVDYIFQDMKTIKPYLMANYIRNCCIMYMESPQKGVQSWKYQHT